MRDQFRRRPGLWFRRGLPQLRGNGVGGAQQSVLCAGQLPEDGIEYRHEVFGESTRSLHLVSATLILTARPEPPSYNLVPTPSRRPLARKRARAATLALRQTAGQRFANRPEAYRRFFRRAPKFPAHPPVNP